MAKREKDPALDKAGNDAGICIAVVNWILAIVLTFMTLA